MKWSLKPGSFAGIRVYMQWTFVLLLGIADILFVNETLHDSQRS